MQEKNSERNGGVLRRDERRGLCRKSPTQRFSNFFFFGFMREIRDVFGLWERETPDVFFSSGLGGSFKI